MPAIGVVRSQVQRKAATHRIAQQICFGDVERIQQAQQVGSGARHLVTGWFVRGGSTAVAEQIDGEQVITVSQLFHHPGPALRRAGEAVQQEQRRP